MMVPPKSSSCLLSSPSFFFFFFNFSHSNMCEVALCVLTLHFPNDWYLLVIPMSSFVRNLFKSLPIFCWIVFLFCWFVFWVWVVCQIFFTNILSPSMAFFFHCINVVFWWAFFFFDEMSQNFSVVVLFGNLRNLCWAEDMKIFSYRNSDIPGCTPQCAYTIHFIKGDACQSPQGIFFIVWASFSNTYFQHPIPLKPQRVRDKEEIPWEKNQGKRSQGV